MHPHNLKRDVMAAQIQSVDGTIVTFTNGKTVKVSDNWISHNEPKAGDYMTDASELIRKADFENQYAPRGDVPVEVEPPPAPEVEMAVGQPEESSDEEANAEPDVNDGTDGSATD